MRTALTSRPKAELKADESSLQASLHAGSSTVAESPANEGFDWFGVDAEHATMSLDILKNKCKAVAAMKAREGHPKEVAVGLNVRMAAPPPFATHLTARQGCSGIEFNRQERRVLK